jgi:hypothetical protein
MNQYCISTVLTCSHVQPGEIHNSVEMTSQASDIAGNKRFLGLLRNEAVSIGATSRSG